MRERTTESREERGPEARGESISEAMRGNGPGARRGR